MEQKIIKVDENTKYELTATIQKCGEDLSICIFGGDRPHIGAVALGVGNIHGLDLKYSPTVSSISVVDHKDDEIARKVAKEVAKKLKIQVVVSVGIHIENAKIDDIVIIEKNIEKLLKSIL